MYDVLKSVISVGDYKLAEIQRKAKKLFVLGDLNEDQLDDLLVMASSSVSAEAERPETLELIHALAEKVHVLETLVKKSAGENSDEQTGYPAWKPWDGISKDYPQGAVVSHNGPPPYIRAVTFGRIEDMGINDANNMGAAMAPAAAATIRQFFTDTNTRAENYDLILTGDLGLVGSRLLIQILEQLKK